MSINKETNNINKNNNKITNSKPKFYYDDKGRKVYDFSSFDYNKSEEDNKNLALKEDGLENNRLVSEFIDTKEALDKTYKYRNEIGNSKISGVYYCDVCKIDMQDSSGYIEHLNGKLHNSRLGVNMKVLKMGVDKVKEKLLSLKKKSELDMIRDRLSNQINKVV